MDENVPQIRVTSSLIIPSASDKNKFIYVLNEKHGNKWTLPAGKLNPFEHPLEGAAREVIEETGITAVVKGLVGVWTFKSPKGNSIINFVYSAEILEGIPQANKKEGILEVKALTLKEVRELFSQGLLTGRANLEPLEEYLRRNRQTYPIDIIKPKLAD